MVGLRPKELFGARQGVTKHMTVTTTISLGKKWHYFMLDIFFGYSNKNTTFRNNLQ